MKCLSFWLVWIGILWTGSLFAGGQYYKWYYKNEYCGKDSDGENEARKRYNADLKSYNDEHPGWVERDEAYKGYLKDLSDYNARQLKYQENKTEWERLSGSHGGAVVDLTTRSHIEGDNSDLVIKKLEQSVSVPSFSSVTNYRTYCQNYVRSDGVRGGSLICENKYQDDSGVHPISFTYTATNREECWSSGSGVLGFAFYDRDEIMFNSKIKNPPVSKTRTVVSQRFSGGLPVASTCCPFTDNDVDDECDRCEAGSVILIGTLKYPIQINGPVYVDGDVVIRGFVKGQGAIYAGRNIHIIGDITYYDPPSWPHDKDDLKKLENCPETNSVVNASKDLLLLTARGNIIVGDYTSVEWTNATQMAYLNLSGRNLKAHGTSETDIGYTAGYPKNKNYTEEDGGKTIVGQKVTDGPDKVGYVDGGGDIKRGYYIKSFNHGFFARNRRYYESSVGEVAIHYLKQTTAKVGSQPSWTSSSTLWKRVLVAFGYYSENQRVTSNTDSGDVTEIDAILYANHGIFGVVGGSVKKKFHLNGAMLCKDEGLLTSFAGRYPDDPSAKAWLNWDLRIKSDLPGGVHVGAPENLSGKKKSGISIKRVTWNLAQ